MPGTVLKFLMYLMKFQASLMAQIVKNLPLMAGDLGLIPVLGRSPGEGNGNPPQYSCLENSMDRGAWHSTVHEVLGSWTQLSYNHELIGMLN